MMNIITGIANETLIQVDYQNSNMDQNILILPFYRSPAQEVFPIYAGSAESQAYEALQPLSVTLSSKVKARH